MIFPKGYVERTFKYGYYSSEEAWLNKRYLGWFCVDRKTDWAFPLVAIPDYEGAGIEISWDKPSANDTIMVQKLKNIVAKFDPTLKPMLDDEWRNGITIFDFCYQE